MSDEPTKQEQEQDEAEVEGHRVNYLRNDDDAPQPGAERVIGRNDEDGPDVEGHVYRGGAERVNYRNDEGDAFR